MPRQYASIGSVSEGTLRDDDLIDSFIWELKQFNKRKAAHFQAEANRIEEEYKSELIDELIDALNEYAPPYSYFGTHEGDGASFGFWPSIVSLQEAIRGGEIAAFEDYNNDMPDYFSGVAVNINDHGNMTFGVWHNGSLKKLYWDCV